MKISSALKALQSGEAIVVRDKTFEPHHIDTFQLETGDRLFWIQDGENMWMSIDVESDEVILFSEIEADLDASSEAVFYAGDDYEFSYETSAKVLDEDEEEEDKVTLKDFERGDGQLLRMMEYEVNGETMSLVGWKVAEEELSGT